MTGQLESNHFFLLGDVVQNVAGTLGTILDAHTHYALVQWTDGVTEEIEQLDARVRVIQRSGKE